jgi:predicted Zn-dependent protease with MMP-like domain
LITEQKTKGDFEMKDLSRMAETKTWKDMTATMNEIVDDYNKRGEKMPDELRKNMEETRVLMTIYREKEIFDMVAEDVFNHLQNESN